MINVCIADNQPVVHFGVISYFKDHNEIRITHNVAHLDNVLEILKTEKVDDRRRLQQTYWNGL